jgi:hypothetical protein
MQIKTTGLKMDITAEKKVSEMVFQVVFKASSLPENEDISIDTYESEVKGETKYFGRLYFWDRTENSKITEGFNLSFKSAREVKMFRKQIQERSSFKMFDCEEKIKLSAHKGC